MSTASALLLSTYVRGKFYLPPTTRACTEWIGLSIVALLDLADEQLGCNGLVIALERWSYRRAKHRCAEDFRHNGEDAEWVLRPLIGELTGPD